MKLWKGEEMEGAFKKECTLFIGSPNITFDEIKKEVELDNEIKQLYFGAGGCTKINTNVVLKCLKEFKYLTTLEIDINKLHEYNINVLKRCYLIITFYNDNMEICEKIQGNIQIKLQAKKPHIVYVEKLNEFIHTDCKSLDGMKYKDDVVIR